MRSTKAIFIKQSKDMFKNPMMLIPFILFPAVALIMTVFVAKGNEHISGNMFIGMMAPMLASWGLIQSAVAVISEDIERKSLRFLIMAGVKPHQYLIGLGGFLLLAGTVSSALFLLPGEIKGVQIVKFMTAMVLSVVASITLGASIGMLAKNQQSAAATSMPPSVVFGFTPMIATFNTTVEKVAGVFYTQQLNVIVNDSSADFLKAVLVMGGNIAVFLGLFIMVYRGKGLKA